MEMCIGDTYICMQAGRLMPLAYNFGVVKRNKPGGNMCVVGVVELSFS